MQRFATMSVLSGLGLFAATAMPASATVLYDSGGFESSAGYAANNFLENQPVSQPLNVWVRSPSSPVGAMGPAAYLPYAAVEPYANATAPNFQYVQVGDTTIPTTNSNFYNPITNVLNPYTPLPSEDVAVTWSMQTLSSQLANHPFFGIVAYGSNGLIGQAGIDASTGQIIGSAGVTTVSPFTAALDTVYNYELLLDYATQKYSIYTGAVGSPTFTLRAIGSFMDQSTDFTDADIASFSATPGTGLAYSGFANFDDYVVQTLPIPEPASIGLAAVAFGLMGKRRTRNGN